MSMAITHFATGAALTAVVLFYLLPPLQHARTIVLLGGFWAMVPDAHWILPVFSSQLYAVHESEVANVFWLHRTFDLLDMGDSRLFGAIAVGAFIGITALTDHWEFTHREQGDKGAAGPLAPIRSLRVISYIASTGGVVLGSVFLLFALRVQSLTGLYAGIGGALWLVGLYGLTNRDRLPPMFEHRITEQVFLLVRIGITLGAVIGGLSLVAAPVRFGISAMSIAYAGLGALILLLIVLLARQWSKKVEKVDR